MAKLYFKYGAMGSSKSAQALITKFNYEERGMKVWLVKPAIDDRDGEAVIKSRIGLQAEAEIIGQNENIREKFLAQNARDVIIADECQFSRPNKSTDSAKSWTKWASPCFVSACGRTF